jgi:hypothetical protein
MLLPDAYLPFHCRAASTPVTVLRLHAGLRVEGQQLQERLHFLQGMLPVEHGMFFSLEGETQRMQPGQY